MDQQGAAGRDPLAPVADVGAGRRVAMRPVDVEHCHLAGDLAVGGIAERAHMADAVGHPGSPQVRSEDLVVRGSGLSETLQLVGAAIVACVRVDGNDCDSLRRGAGEHDRAAPTEAADLDDRVAGVGRGRSAVQALGLIRAHPAVHVAHCLQRFLERSHSAHPTYTPSPNTIAHTTPNSCRVRSAAKISSGAAP